MCLLKNKKNAKDPIKLWVYKGGNSKAESCMTKAEFKQNVKKEVESSATEEELNKLFESVDRELGGGGSLEISKLRNAMIKLQDVGAQAEAEVTRMQKGLTALKKKTAADPMLTLNAKMAALQKEGAISSNPCADAMERAAERAAAGSTAEAAAAPAGDEPKSAEG